jgi:hypothetical protein
MTFVYLSVDVIDSDVDHSRARPFTKSGRKIQSYTGFHP